MNNLTGLRFTDRWLKKIDAVCFNAVGLEMLENVGNWK